MTNKRVREKWCHGDIFSFFSHNPKESNHSDNVEVFKSGQMAHNYGHKRDREV